MMSHTQHRRRWSKKVLVADLTLSRLACQRWPNWRSSMCLSSIHRAISALVTRPRIKSTFSRSINGDLFHISRIHSTSERSLFGVRKSATLPSQAMTTTQYIESNLRYVCGTCERPSSGILWNFFLFIKFFSAI